MANVLYPAFKEGLLKKAHDLSADTIMASLIDLADYTYNAADTTYVAGAGGVADAAKVSAQALATPTVLLGVFDTVQGICMQKM